MSPPSRPGRAHERAHQRANGAGRCRGLRSIILVTSPYHQRRAYGTFAAASNGNGLRILNHHADSTDWHPLTWFLFRRNRVIVRGERRRIDRDRERGDVL